AGDERGLAVELQVHVFLLETQDRLGGVADPLDIPTAVEERDDAARATFERSVAPREGADDGALAKHHLDVAAKILGVQQTLLEGPVVEWEHVIDDPAAGSLMGVFERSEEFTRRLAVQLGELGREIGPHRAD